jgi:hypothetical protein
MSHIDHEPNQVENASPTSVEEILLRLLTELENSIVKELDLSILGKDDDLNAVKKSVVGERNALRLLDEEYAALAKEYEQIPLQLTEIKNQYQQLTRLQSELNAADPFDAEVINRLQEINNQIQDVLQEARPYTSRLSEIEKRESQIRELLIPSHQNNLSILEQKLAVLVVLDRFSSLKYHLSTLNKQGGIPLTTASLARALESLAPKKAATEQHVSPEPVTVPLDTEVATEILSTDVIEALLFKLLASTEEEEQDVDPEFPDSTPEDAEVAIDLLLTIERPPTQMRDWRSKQSERIVGNWKDFFVGQYESIEEKKRESMIQGYRDLIKNIFAYEKVPLSPELSWLDYLEMVVYVFELTVEDINNIFNPNNTLTASSVRKIISVFYRHQHSSFVMAEEFEELADKIRGGEWPLDKKIGDIVQEMYPSSSRSTQETVQSEPDEDSWRPAAAYKSETYTHIPQEGEQDFVDIETDHWKKYSDKPEKAEEKSERLTAIQEEILEELKWFAEIAILKKLTRASSFGFHIMMKVINIDTKVTHQLRTRFQDYPETRGFSDGEDEFSIVDVIIMLIVKKRNILTNTRALVTMYNAIREESDFIRKEWKKLTQGATSA